MSYVSPRPAPLDYVTTEAVRTLQSALVMGREARRGLAAPVLSPQQRSALTVRLSRAQRLEVDARQALDELLLG